MIFGSRAKRPAVESIGPQEAFQLLQSGDAVLIDVREPAEHASEHIVGARLAPLSAFQRQDFSADRGRTAIFHCRSGMRTTMNAARLASAGFARTCLLEGGLDAWRRAGLPLDVRPKAKSGQ